MDLTQQKKTSVIGGVDRVFFRIIDAGMPWMALVTAASILQVLILFNAEDLVDKHQQLIACAEFCVCGAFLYIIYMFMQRMANLVISAVEGQKPPGGQAPYDNTDDEDEVDEETPIVTPAPPGVPMLREDVLAGMYLGGAGTFLALPGLCMFDASATCALITGLQIMSIGERIKPAEGRLWWNQVVEYRSGTDRVTAIAVLRVLHWAQHLCMALVVLSVIWYTTRNGDGDWPLVALSLFAPALLRGSCNERKRDMPTMSATHSLEAGLPVASLLATMVMCWYSPTPLQPHGGNLGRMIPMLLISPATLGIMIAFIQRGFRKKQTLGTCVVFVVMFVVLWAIRLPPARRNEMWIPVSGCAVMVVAAVARGVYSMDVVMCDERTYIRAQKVPVSEQI